MLRSLLILNKCSCYDVRTWEKFESTGLPLEAFTSGSAVWRDLGITDRNIGIMERAVSSGWADRELEKCERLGVSIVTCRDRVYPPTLREMSDGPLVLYVKGNLPAVRESVAVVGTRRCSMYASDTAFEIGRTCAAYGAAVVSGGARGIDGAGHSGCMDGGGVTAAVLGTGVDRVYPSEHRELFEHIAERGALCSEYPIGTEGEPWRFPRRNRIIVGLSSSVVIVEAPLKSGAMITARLAAEEGREVWAVPGRISDDRCAGSNMLIFDGASPLVDPALLFEVRNRRKIRPEDGQDETWEAPAPMSEEERAVTDILARRSGSTIDNLAGEAKMSAAEVFKIMSGLALRGIVFQSGPGRYRLRD
ncbi:MAG: DNA-processing protein DprA [Synergistaceae bacterium]|nr:DNA-processing protein DprA [Synergistaceae bacterium]